MSITANLKWGFIALNPNPKGEVIKILEGWEEVWQQKIVLEDYQNRVRAVEKVCLMSGDRDAYTSEEKRLIHIRYPGGGNLKAREHIDDEIIGKKMGDHGKMGAAYDIADAIVFEAGNCHRAQDYIDNKKAFIDGLKPLKLAGMAKAKIEGEVMVGYLKLMEAISEANDRAYQSNRNICAFSNCNTNEIKVAHFCYTPHNVDMKNATAGYSKTWLMYAHEMVKSAKKTEIEELACNLGNGMLLYYTPDGKSNWRTCVAGISKDLGVKDAENCDLLYDVVTHLLNRIISQGHGRKNRLLSGDNWLLDYEIRINKLKNEGQIIASKLPLPKF